MSMLTPPGMGGKYKITGNAYPRMRRPRRRRRFLSVMAVATVTGMLGWGTLELVGIFTGEQEAGAAQKTGCLGNTGKDERSMSAPPPKLPQAATITVNVYNATTRTGLAKRVADELKKRGFKVGKVDNAPAVYDKKVTETAVLVGGSKAEPALSVLGAHLAGTRSTEDRRKDAASVDLIIGKAFKQFESPRVAAKTLTDRAKPTPPTTGKDC